MTRNGVFLALFALVLWTIGCGGGNRGSSEGNPGTVSLSIAPAVATVAPGNSITLTVTAANTGILWPEAVAGEYRRNGNIVTYTPPAIEGSYDFTVVAAADPLKKVTAKITVKQADAGIAIFPKTATIRQEMDFRFVADVQPEQIVTWNVSGDCGSIAPDGRFHALQAGTCSVTASAPNSGRDISASAEITVLAGTVNTGTVSVLTLAESFNVSADAFTQCYTGEAVEAVEADMLEGARLFRVNGTPTNVLLNRQTGAYKTVLGAYPSDTFESALAELLVSDTLPSVSLASVESVLADARFYGNPNAPIILIVYSDLLCSYCKRHHEDQTVETIVANHPGEVTMVLKNYPLLFHQTASLGARGVYCAGKVGGDDLYYSYLAQAIKASAFTD